MIATVDTLSALARVLGGCGWDQVGGRLLRAQGDQGEVVGRTDWIPRAPWWLERPDGLTERRCHQVVADALAGRRLGPRQRRYLTWLMAIAEAERRGALSDNSGRAEDFAITFER